MNQEEMRRIEKECDTEDCDNRAEGEDCGPDRRNCCKACKHSQENGDEGLDYTHPDEGRDA